LSGFKTKPRKLFVTHGELETAKHFAAFVEEKTGWQTFVPAYESQVLLG